MRSATNYRAAKRNELRTDPDHAAARKKAKRERLAHARQTRVGPELVPEKVRWARFRAPRTDRSLAQ